ncbi:aldo/keto reductase [Alicyclobacillus fastidiosus]|uniref:Aldo/keto reductase n=1 Tax=Alicyclobacillus fastidiosus TaxID=392011 RepID=A0ABV5ALR3_9BACL|nr:aldo/keto reductase [Alicyclobacillus fastidiosus]WEH08859.1 aldo/keto reductase [Alicyclobacillus fastidiosus]
MKMIDIAGLSKPCSQLIMGSMVFSPDDMDRCRGLLDAFVEAGGNAIDLAHIYNGGRSELAVGKWLQERDREKLVIIDKGAHPHGNRNRVNAKDIAADLNESLQRLGVDAIDVYLLHRDDPAVPVGDILEILNEHKSAGKIEVFGTSNWTWQRIEEANEYAYAHGLDGFCCNSPNLSLATANEPRWPGCVTVDAETLVWHERTLLPLLSWSSQAGGFFTGRYSPEIQEDADMVRVYYNAQNWNRLARATELAVAKGVDANAIALAYVLNQRFPTAAIIGPHSLVELQSSLVARDVQLNEEEIDWLLTGRQVS